MGTTWSVTALLPARIPAETLTAAIARSLDAVVSQMSAWVPQSDLSRFNRAEPGSCHALPAEFFCVLDYALSVAAETDGAYDPTVGALAALWGFGPEGRASRAPSDEAIAAARARCGWERLRLTRNARRAVQPGGLTIDVCAVGKGFAVDCLADVMRAHGCTDFLAEIGGELRGEGCKPDGSPWWVSVEAPRAASNMPQTLIALHDVSVATSGDQRRYVEHGGRRYGHTIDPRTGYPVSNGIVSVTVVARTCMEADALSTGLYVMGEEAGRRFADRHGIAALFVMEDEHGLRESLSPAFDAMTR
jgi:FAD:protein FMN transferase